MKAWHVQNPDGEMQEIIFAEKRGKAIVSSEAYSMSGEYIRVEAKRAKYADGLHNDYEALLQAKLDNGWWIECFDCNTQVTEENEYTIRNNGVFCENCSIR